MYTLMVNECTMVSSRVLTLTWRISSERLSSAAMILSACPGARRDTVFSTRLGPANSTFTSGRVSPAAAGLPPAARAASSVTRLSRVGRYGCAVVG